MAAAVMRALPPQHLNRMASTLMAYAASFGLTGPLQRRVAARLWRAVPRGLPPDEAVRWLDEQVSAWAFALIGHAHSEAAIRLAFLTSRLDPLALLGPHDGSPAMARLARALRAALHPPMPAAAPRVMPVQSFSAVTVTPVPQVCAA